MLEADSGDRVLGDGAQLAPSPPARRSGERYPAPLAGAEPWPPDSFTHFQYCIMLYPEKKLYRPKNIKTPSLHKNIQQSTTEK